MYTLYTYTHYMQVFEEAERIEPDDREVWHNKGLCTLYLKNYDVAI